MYLSVDFWCVLLGFIGLHWILFVLCIWNLEKIWKNFAIKKKFLILQFFFHCFLRFQLHICWLLNIVPQALFIILVYILSVLQFLNFKFLENLSSSLLIFSVISNLILSLCNAYCTSEILFFNSRDFIYFSILEIPFGSFK